MTRTYVILNWTWLSKKELIHTHSLLRYGSLKLFLSLVFILKTYITM